MFRIHTHRALTEPAVTIERIDESGPTSTAALRIDGLLCSLCAANVQGRLEGVEGVQRADVDLESGIAEVTYGTGEAEPEALREAVESAVVLRPLRRLLAKLGGRGA